MDHHKTNNSPSSLMIWVCHSSTSGVIKSPSKSSDNWLNKTVSIGWIRLKEVTSRTSKTCHLLEQWTIQEEVETTFPTDSKDSFSFSTWSCHYQSKEFTVPSLSSSSELTLRTQVFLIKSRKLLITWHQQPSSCGNSSKSSCFPLQPNSTICSTCVNSLVHSRASSRSRRNL